VVRLLLTIAALVFLLAPIYLFYFVQDRVIMLVFLTVFAVGFAGVLAVGTKSRNVEIFAALAA
jgi:hypothetical protein